MAGEFTQNDIENAVIDAEAETLTGSPGISTPGVRVNRRAFNNSDRLPITFAGEDFDTEKYPKGLPPYSLVALKSAEFDEELNRTVYTVDTVDVKREYSEIPLVQFFVTGNYYTEPGTKTTGNLVYEGRTYRMRVEEGQTVRILKPVGPDLKGDGSISERGWGFTSLSTNFKISQDETYQFCEVKREVLSPAAIVRIEHKTTNLAPGESALYGQGDVYAAEIVTPNFSGEFRQWALQGKRISGYKSSDRHVYVFEANEKRLELGKLYIAHNVGAAWVINEQSVWGVPSPTS